MGGLSLDEFFNNYKNLWAQYARRVNTDYATVLCPGEHTIFVILWVFFFFLTDISIVILDLFYGCWNHFLSLFFWIQMSQLIGLLGSNF